MEERLITGLQRTPFAVVFSPSAGLQLLDLASWRHHTARKGRVRLVDIHTQVREMGQVLLHGRVGPPASLRVESVIE